MKETWGGELVGKPIRIENRPVGGPANGWNTMIHRLDTGQLVENITEIAISIKTSELVVAEITLAHVLPGRQEPVLETIAVQNPELDVEALVRRERLQIVKEDT